MFRNSIPRPLGIVAVIVLLGTILNPPSASGQDKPSPTSSRPAAVTAQSAANLSVDRLRLRRTEVEASQSLDKASKDGAINLLDQAIGFGEARDEFNRLSEALSRQIKSAPQRIQTIQAELARPFQPPQAVKTKGAKKDSLELAQRLQKEQAQLAAAKDVQAGWNDQLDKQKDLLGHLPKNIADAKARLKTVDEELQNQSAGDDTGLVAEARRLMLRTKQLKLRAAIKVYEQQLDSHELLVSLSRAERDLAAREIAQRETLIKAWQSAVEKKVQEEATQVRQEAEEARDKAPE